MVNTQQASDPCGVIVCHSNCVRLQTVGGHLVDIIHFPERSSKVYYTSHCEAVLGRIDVRADDHLLAWGSGVRTSDAIKVYDYATGVMKHSITCKLRHAVTALNFEDSPPQMIASGDTDYRLVLFVEPVCKALRTSLYFILVLMWGVILDSLFQLYYCLFQLMLMVTDGFIALCH